eukprot:COSAG01_NODE_1558_length_9925_cov_6.973743_1_plen_105_part_00
MLLVCELNGLLLRLPNIKCMGCGNFRCLLKLLKFFKFFVHFLKFFVLLFNRTFQVFVCTFKLVLLFKQVFNRTLKLVHLFAKGGAVLNDCRNFWTHSVGAGTGC